jgi:hypothetical protein
MNCGIDQNQGAKKRSDPQRTDRLAAVLELFHPLATAEAAAGM